MIRFLLLSAAFSLCAGCQRPGRIDVPPGPILLSGPDETAPLVARVFSTEGKPLGGRVSWASSADSIVSVDGAGLAHAHGPGTATLTASLQGVTSAPVQVEVAFATSLRTDSSEVVLGLHSGPARPNIEALGTDGAPLKTHHPRYSSRDEKVCRVDASGTFFPVGPGITVVTASIAGKSIEIRCVVR